MKKLYSMLLSAVVVASSSIVSAQQLPNIGFENWKAIGTCGSTESFGATDGMRQRPGIEPAEWNGSSVNQKVGVEKTEELVFREETYFASGKSSAVMKNLYVGVNLVFTKIGSVAPGFLTFGTPWVYAVASVDKCDGGIYGGMAFTYKPDAITGKFMRIDSNNENSYIIAYLWNGTFKSKVGEKGNPTVERENEIRGIFGKVDATGDGKLVAKCDYGFKLSRPADLLVPEAWTEITVPLEYVEGAGEPTMMNVVISGGNFWDRGALKEKTTLLADDVKFVYYSRLNGVKVDGVSIEGFASDKYNYEIPEELPTKEQIELAVLGQSATTSVEINQENLTVTITVSNVEADIDGAKSHTYVLKYAKAGVENVEIDNNAPVEYYNLQGVKVANPENGIFIKVQGSKATKVVL